MKSWKVVVVSFCYYHLCMWAASHRSRALFPSASRVKRGLAEMVNPIFHNSVEDVNLLFEILLAWLPVLEESGSFYVPDEELASMRQTQKLGLIYEDVLPQRLTDIRRLGAHLSRRQAPLRREDFERTVLTMVYTASRMANTTGHQREAWVDSFVSLYRAVKQDLTPRTP
ncbi:protein FAM180A-like [Brienomyrus brachyistius]|uniref:protein FAM180A-like n=1 Tax=Brienomyrus brachyistius TaxID=42636 RepID=UPI0020B36BF7|nr:protein FAM180A-like [Brienomyrus brachyistius]